MRMRIRLALPTLDRQNKTKSMESTPIDTAFNQLRPVQTNKVKTKMEGNTIHVRSDAPPMTGNVKNETRRTLHVFMSCKKS